MKRTIATTILSMTMLLLASCTTLTCFAGSVVDVYLTTDDYSEEKGSSRKVGGLSAYLYFLLHRGRVN